MSHLAKDEILLVFYIYPYTQIRLYILRATKINATRFRVPAPNGSSRTLLKVKSGKASRQTSVKLRTAQ